MILRGDGSGINICINGKQRKLFSIKIFRFGNSWCRDALNPPSKHHAIEWHVLHQRSKVYFVSWANHILKSLNKMTSKLSNFNNAGKITANNTL